MMADNTANGAEADALENQADALEAEGARKEEAIDDADANAATDQRGDSQRDVSFFPAPSGTGNRKGWNPKGIPALFLWPRAS